MKHGVNYVMALRHQGLNHLSNLSFVIALNIWIYLKKITTINI